MSQESEITQHFKNAYQKLGRKSSVHLHLEVSRETRGMLKRLALERNTTINQLCINAIFDAINNA